MGRQIELVCTVCAEVFQVPIGVYHAHVGVVPCPCCGSTDLVATWGRGEAVASRRRTQPV